MISIIDSHRLLYKNAVIRAFCFEDRTIPVSFFNADGVDVGETLRTNESGYLVNAEGTHQITSYFVKQKSIVQVSLDNGFSWPIEYIVESNIGADDIQDGSLLNKHGVRVWSANAKESYQLDYKDLSNQPDIRPWGEAEQCENTEKSDEIIVVSQFTKVLHIDGVAVNVSIWATEKRYGQQVSVCNHTDHPISVFDLTGVKLFMLDVGEARAVFSQKLDDADVVVFRALSQLERKDIPVIPDAQYTRIGLIKVNMTTGNVLTVDVSPLGTTELVGSVVLTPVVGPGKYQVKLTSSNLSKGGRVGVYFNCDRDIAKAGLELLRADGSVIDEIFGGEWYDFEVAGGEVIPVGPRSIASPVNYTINTFGAGDFDLTDNTWVLKADRYPILYPRCNLHQLIVDLSQIPANANDVAVYFMIPSWLNKNTLCTPVDVLLTRLVGESGTPKGIYLRIMDDTGKVLFGPFLLPLKGGVVGATLRLGFMGEVESGNQFKVLYSEPQTE